MSISSRLALYLAENGIPYNVVAHPQATTAQEVAASMHVPGRKLAKVVILKIDGKFAMAVSEAPQQIDFERLKQELGADEVQLASEQEFMELFPDCEVGGMPPFGNLYGLPVYVDETLARDAEIFFNAGTHSEAIQMSFADYARLVKPIVLDYACQPV